MFSKTKRPKSTDDVKNATLKKRQSYKSETDMLELTIQEKQMNRLNNSSDGKESWN